MEDNSGTDRYDVQQRVLNELTREVAGLLPFLVKLDADMGYTGALFIDLGRRGDEDDPPDTASIDCEVSPVVWVFDVEGGRETVASDFGPDSDPTEVARWIAGEAHRVQSPATQWPTQPPSKAPARPSSRRGLKGKS